MPTVTLIPNGAGDLTELTPVGDIANWMCVDDDNADTSYVKNATTTDVLRDLYALPASGIPAGSTINSVTIYIKCRYTNSTFPASFQTVVKTEGTVYGSGVAGVGLVYTLKSKAYATNPNTGVAWTIAEIDAMQIGVGIGSGLDEDTPKYWMGRCTYVYAVVDYTEVGPGGVISGSASQTPFLMLTVLAQSVQEWIRKRLKRRFMASEEYLN